MKFLGRISLFFTLVFSLGFTAGAAYHNVSYLPEMGEYEEIKAVLPEMLSEINEIAEEEGYHQTVEAEDILLEEAYPIYLNENYFSPEIGTPEDLLSMIEQQEHYVWKLPVKLGSQVLLIGLGKGYPVREEVRKSASPEVIADIEKNEGKWHLTTVEFVPKAELYTQKVKNAGIDADQVVFVNGPTGSYIQMAICIDNDKFQDVLSLTSAEISRQTNGMSGSENDILAFDDGAHYTYQELQESLGMVNDQIDNMPDGGNTLLALGGGAGYDGNGGIHAKNLTVGLGFMAVAVLLLTSVAAGIKYHTNRKHITK